MTKMTVTVKCDRVNLTGELLRRVVSGEGHGGTALGTISGPLTFPLWHYSPALLPSCHKPSASVLTRLLP